MINVKKSNQSFSDRVNFNLSDISSPEKETSIYGVLNPELDRDLDLIFEQFESVIFRSNFRNK